MEEGLFKKFRIKQGDKLYLVNAPSDFRQTMGELPDEAKISPSKNAQQVHWFVKDTGEVKTQVEKVLALLNEGSLLWVYFPKGSSKIQTDLTRDKGWDLLTRPELKWMALVSFDETWSAFALKKDSSPEVVTRKVEQQEFPEYIDPVKKTVKIPEDLEEAFIKKDKLKNRFLALAYSHKKEYVHWILSAKREETRIARINGTLEMLEQGLKNPSDKRRQTK
jgi:hypothetical protein